jgi:glucokinase
MINLISPEVIVLGGGVIEALWDVMSEPIQKHAFDHALPFARRGVRIVKAVLGDDAGVIGAATMARQRMAEIKDAAEAPTLILRNNPFGGMKGPERSDA